jgi:hypothetical protein
MHDTAPWTTTLAVVCVFPAATLIVLLLALAQPAVLAAAGFAGVVGVGVWLAGLRRQHLPQSAQQPVRSWGICGSNTEAALLAPDAYP